MALLQYWSTALCVQCAVADENETFETVLGSRLGYLSVIASVLFLNRDSHSTSTIIQHNIHLHKMSLQCRLVRDCAIMMSRASVVATVENTT